MVVTTEQILLKRDVNFLARERIDYVRDVDCPLIIIRSCCFSQSSPAGRSNHPTSIISNTSTSQTASSPDEYFSPHQLLALESLFSMCREDTLHCHPYKICKEFYPKMDVFESGRCVGSAPMKEELTNSAVTSMLVLAVLHMSSEV